MTDLRSAIQRWEWRRGAENALLDFFCMIPAACILRCLFADFERDAAVAPRSGQGLRHAAAWGVLLEQTAFYPFIGRQPTIVLFHPLLGNRPCWNALNAR